METHKILIIDDSESDCAIVRRYIARRGQKFDIEEVGSGEEGERRLLSNKYDCVFLDYMLPDKDGIQVLKTVYDPATELTPSPIVMMTGMGNESIVIDAINYGAQDYLNKGDITAETLHIAQVKAKHNFKVTQERNKAIKHLVQSQKLESIGRLTGGIAHDFNNLLQIIMGHASLIQKQAVDSPEILKRTKAILQTAERGAHLTHRMLSFAREQDLRPTELQIDALFHEVKDLLLQSIGSQISLTLHANNDVPQIWADKVQLEMALINLAINARDAMPQGGKLIISANRQIVDDDYFFYRKNRLTHGTYLELTISDTGEGIPFEIQDKIFDPFFTTKGPDKGTGLGLSMVFGFVEQSGGYISVYSEEGQGTTFKILLPEKGEQIKDESKEREIGAAPIALAPVDIKSENDNTPPLLQIEMHEKSGPETHKRHILVIEDNPDISSFVWSALDELGYRITMVENADRALEFYQSAIESGEKIDLVFSDVIVPGKYGGLQLLECIRAINSNQPFLMTSGHAGTSAENRNILDLYRVNILHKPYRIEKLGEEINLAMGVRHENSSIG